MGPDAACQGRALCLPCDEWPLGAVGRGLVSAFRSSLLRERGWEAGLGSGAAEQDRQAVGSWEANEHVEVVGRGHWPVASPFPPSSPWGKTAAWLALQEVSGAPSACPLAFMAVLAWARSATVLSLPRPAPALSTSFCGDHGGCSGSVPGDPVGFALELQLVFEKNKGRAPGLRADLFLGVLVLLMFSLRCTCSWAPPAGSSWPLTLRLSFLFLFTHMEPQCCDQSTSRVRSVGGFGSVARSDHSPLGRKGGRTASRLVHLQLLSLHAVPTRLDPSSAVTLRTVSAHQVLRRCQASRACAEAPVTRNRDTTPLLREHPSGVHARDRAIITGCPGQAEKGQRVHL